MAPIARRTFVGAVPAIAAFIGGVPSPPAGSVKAPPLPIAPGTEWAHRCEAAAPPAEWTSLGFDASDWDTGCAPFGWERTDVGPTPTADGTRPLTAYFRRTFTVVDPAGIAALEIATRADDGIVVHVNGTEVARTNMPAGTVTHGTYATAAPRDPTPVTITAPGSLLTSGLNVITAEVHLNWSATPTVSFDLDAQPVPSRSAGERARHAPTVAVYNGTADGADDIFHDALGATLGAGVSYYTVDAKQGGDYVLRSWDLTRMARGYVPYIHLQSVAHDAAAGADVQYYPWQHVADGVHDAEFIRWAHALRNAPSGTSFTFDGEPEVRLESGSHQPVPNPNSPVGWPAGWPQNGDGLNTPAAYAAAQRRIHDLMHPIAPHIDYRFWFAGHQRHSVMESFYPGDAYVDSLGIDPYVWAHDPASTTPLEKYQPIVDWFRSRTWGHGKPIGISETGIDTGHGDAAGAAFWDAMPEAVTTLDLAFVTLYNRVQWEITPATHPLSWTAYVRAMGEIAA
jgi:hypothetical protein